MTRDELVVVVFDELSRAEEEHPFWPADLLHGVAIITEEVGELA